VYADTMKKKRITSRLVSVLSVDDENDSDKEDKKKRKIPTLVMWYLLVIDHLKYVFSNPRDVELACWHSERSEKMMRRFDTLRMKLSGNFFIFNINHLDQRVEI
jgi:hypothetical protein